MENLIKTKHAPQTIKINGNKLRVDEKEEKWGFEKSPYLFKQINSIRLWLYVITDTNKLFMMGVVFIGMHIYGPNEDYTNNMNKMVLAYCTNKNKHKNWSNLSRAYEHVRITSTLGQWDPMHGNCIYNSYTCTRVRCVSFGR